MNSFRPTRKRVYRRPDGVQSRSIGQTPIKLSTWTNDHSNNDLATRRRSAIDRLTINTLPDNVLLGIFRLSVDDAGALERWRALVCVCQRWRYVVLSSPRHLNLRLLCTEATPAKAMINAWPSLPIIIKDDGKHGADNIIDALEHSDRVCEVSLPNLESTLFLRIVEIMSRGPFRQLTSLEIGAAHDDETPTIVSDSFLGGSARRLQKLELKNIPFPALPNLLLSATDLVHLRLWDVPDSAYIYPDAMVTCLPALTRLESFHLGFRSPRPPPDPASRHPPPPTRTILPSLTQLFFRGNSEYFDDLVTQIEIPLLESLHITFFNQLVFDKPQLTNLIGRAGKLNKLNQADILFHDDHVEVRLSSQEPSVGRESVVLVVRCNGSFWQRSALVQLLGPALPPLSTLERLDIFGGHDDPGSCCQNIDDAQWIELLRPFIALKKLYLSEELAPRVLLALQELIGDGPTELLPALQSLFLEAPQQLGPVQEAIAKFIEERRLSGHHIAVHHGKVGNWVDECCPPPIPLA